MFAAVGGILQENPEVGTYNQTIQSGRISNQKAFIVLSKSS